MTRKAVIYTKTGDDGTTSLIGNSRVRKNHPRVEAYGTLDELNAHLGLLNVAIADCDTKALIEQIENHIITLGSYLANDKKRSGDTITLVVPKRIGECELKDIPMPELDAWLKR